MARARGASARFGGRPRRKTVWVGPADQDVVAVATGTSVIIASFDPQASFMAAPTIVRTRGAVSIRNSVVGSDVTIGGAFGVCVVSDEAFVAGTAAIPRVFDDADWGGWLVWQSFESRFEFADGTGAQGPNESSLLFQVDSKAMRKITTNETVLLMCESQTGALNIAMHLRLLFMLS